MAQELQPHILRKFQILQKLGKGAYGVVWKAVDKQTKQVVALKKVFDAFQNATDSQRTYREVIFLQELNGHPNIVSLLNIIKAQSPKDIYLVFDFMQTDLHAVIRANIMQNVHKKYVLYQVLKGIKYMHSGQLIHRDLKPSNILLDSDCLAKLADFGLARSVASVNQSVSQPIMTEYVATRWYRAPQILLGSSKYTKAVDMWSVGCILGQLYFGKAIFPGTSTLNQIERIIQLLGKPTKDEIESMESVMAKECLNQINFVKKRSFSSFFQNMDQLGLDLLRKLLVFNPKKRLSVEQALNHPYLQQFHDQSQEITYNGVIQIAIDQNTKYSIKEYRQALHREINKRKDKKHFYQTSQPMQVISQNQLRKRQKQRQAALRTQKQKQQQLQKSKQIQRQKQRQRQRQRRIYHQQQLQQQEQMLGTTKHSHQSRHQRDSINGRKRESNSVSKENYYYHSISQHNSTSNHTGQSRQKSTSQWMRSQKGRSFYGTEKENKAMQRTYTQQYGRKK